ncbi:glycosyl hydrolase 115 family protein [Kutzneria sp. CA-103260]|uniref:glycosyl hydrolase 115 family protein n=1 Tax=Kutzneria sp. CA-103260 TaxID=2802641 RepID=UPI001BEF3348|nr:glycosyl hydrolase 115 family protein [Kutzneria sp. CA-103260]QUQ64629.1 Glycosyl hydrolase family 115 [Kutzneria sp. CA-103260]
MAPLDRRGFLGMVGALAAGSSLSLRSGPGSFPLVANRKAAPLVVSSSDHPGVVRVAADLRDDIERVTGVRPELHVDHVPAVAEVVVIGSLDASPLVRAMGLDTTGIAGKWETSLTEVVAGPDQRTLVITGSDQRGTIYGAYDISRQIGVSPWHWWDDVPPRHRDELHISPGRHSLGTPAVKYRGLFINDENPALGTWAPAFFGPGLAPGYPGGFTSGFYEKVFETMLRLRANYLWPAVWGRAFAEDDPLNHATAKRYGIVMGTSHEAPMMRGIEEWNRHAVPAVRDTSGAIVTPGHDPYGGTGEWSFRHNADAIKAYWADGIRRMVTQDFEGVVTVGMRGTGDTRLPDGDSIDLMRDILAAERTILADVTGRDPATVPQVWTLYTEVMRYWAEGLRPADDVTVVFPDDNWGNIRKLPDPALPPRQGGYGLYYHFDFVGPGRCYKWNDTSVIANTWEQLNQAIEFGVDRLWVANVGDLKGNELPLQFFLDYAWKPLPLAQLSTWERQYTEQNFGASVAADLAALLHDYGKLQALRKPELLNRHSSVDPAKNPATDPTAIIYDDQASPYSLTDYGELDRVTEQWQQLAVRAQQIADRLPAASQDAYFELVGYEVASTANLYALRRAEFTNILYAAQGRAAANDLAAEAESRFAQDLALSERFNNDIAGGKWRGFQTQPHIDYGDVARYGPDAPWQQPQINNAAIPDVLFPAIQRIPLAVDGALGVAVDGSSQTWPGGSATAVLPEFSPFQSQPGQYIDVFNRGSKKFTYRVRPDAPWLTAQPAAGVVDGQVRVKFAVDWKRAPRGTTQVPVVVTGAGQTVTVLASVVNRELPSAWRQGSIEANGYVSVDAAIPTATIPAHGIAWQRIPDIGRHGDGMKPFPVTATSQPAGSGPRLEYRMTLFTTGPVTVWAHLSPRNDVLPTPGLRYAVSFDDQSPQVVDIIAATGSDSTALNRQWERNTSDNINLTSTRHVIASTGPHVLKFWMVDPTVVVQKLVVDTGGLRPSYLGPPPSMRL